MAGSAAVLARRCLNINTFVGDMSDITIRSATDADEARLLAAIADQQDYERALHDTRKPGLEIAALYFAYLRTRVAQDRGVLLVAERDSAFAGYAAGWIENEDNVAETADSNRFGYIADTYVIPAFRGLGIAAVLIQVAERHLRASGISRIRIRALANNASALRAYMKSAFVPYEIVLEKRVA
jgi:GNAT superfamily N-acetyltransferase